MAVPDKDYVVGKMRDIYGDLQYIMLGHGVTGWMVQSTGGTDTTGQEQISFMTALLIGDMRDFWKIHAWILSRRTTRLFLFWITK